jgi:sec-independent protein translocase protein TatA
MPFGIAWWEILLILLLVLLVFGPKRLPEMGRSIGRGMREFKDSLTSRGDEDDDDRERQLVAPEDEASVAAAAGRDREAAR